MNHLGGGSLPDFFVLDLKSREKQHYKCLKRYNEMRGKEFLNLSQASQP